MSHPDARKSVWTEVERILDSITDACFGLDGAWRFTYINAQAERLLGRTRAEMRGRSVWEVCPETVGSAFDRGYRRAVAERTPVAFEEHSPSPVDTWFEARAYPSPDGLSVYLSDITQRKRAEEALRRSEARYRSLVDPATQLVWTNTPEGEMRGPNPQWGAFTGQREDEYQGYGWAAAVHPDDAQPTVAAWRRCVETRTPFVFEHRVRRSDGVYRTFGIRAFPVLDSDGRIQEWAGIHTDVTEQREMDARLAASYRREVLLNRIGQAVRRADAPEEIEQAALAGLAEALRADRCLSIAVDKAADRVRFVAEWRRPDLPSLIGDYPIPGFGAEIGHSFPAAQALAISDVRQAPWPAGTLSILAEMPTRALLDVPFLSGGEVVGALSVSMAETPRVWTDDEAALVEAVASQLRSALESARAGARERRIATELQRALQPPVPGHVPGLRISPFLRPALEEAGVGGDFYDVFALDESSYALVIGDVSGKGLAAAAQLALVRNSLRTMLYLSGDPQQAVTGLNAILTAHNLLLGFVTVFVGVYDVGTGGIRYVSCGHEPPLLRRAATGDVEALEPTGLPLGVVEGAAYTTGLVSLCNGDGLLLYTDGLSEAGPSRREMLGTAGLTRMLAGMPRGDAHAVTARLVSEVGAFAQGVFRDDVCVLMIERC